MLASLCSAATLYFLSRDGLNLPVDFQPDPNYAHTLFAINLASGGLYFNTFFPAVINSYAYAYAILLGGSPLPSDEGFGLSSVYSAMVLSRYAQLFLTCITLSTWIFAFNSFLLLKTKDYEDGIHQSGFIISIASLSVFLCFSYSFIYSSYFLRPDNMLSASMALGIIIMVKSQLSFNKKLSIDAINYLMFGAWALLMTITKSQGQILIFLFFAYLIAQTLRSSFLRPLSSKQDVVVTSICLIAAVVLIEGFFRHKSQLDGEIFYFFIAPLTIALILSPLLLINRLMRMRLILLYPLAGWSSIFIATYAVMGYRNFYFLVRSANPFETIVVQMGIGNLAYRPDAISFNFYHLLGLGIIPTAIAVLGCVIRHRRFPIFLTFAAIMMALVTSLRIEGYYNLILCYPFVAVAAALTIYESSLIRKSNWLIFALLLLLPLHATLMTTRHNQHIDAYNTVCIVRNSLATVTYYPDTINLKFTMEKEHWIEYSSHYFQAFTEMAAPDIREKLVRDPEYQKMVQGELQTCRS